MKLRFSIQYGTQWGENLHVVIHFISTDGTIKRNNLLMTTDDGSYWSLETAALASAQHPIASFTYYYQVEDGDGQVIRREWTQVPRSYPFDASKSYIFPDQWRDIPLQHHLYSRACRITNHMAVDEQVQPIRMPFYRKTLLFRVSAPQLAKGQSVAIIGSHPTLGDWNPTRYLRMEYLGQCEWMLSANVDAILLPLEYKYVIIDDQTNELVTWEEGDNRRVELNVGLSTPDSQLRDGSVMVLYGESLRVKERTWRAAGVVVPVFSLRSTHSFGVGDFGDLRRFVDWAETTGMKVIQLLPVNDTTCSRNWCDSYPYNIVSAFALHPHYLDVEALGDLKSKSKMTAYHRQQQELNALPYSDYELVDRVKAAYVRDIFEERGRQTLDTKEYKTWYRQNESWLVPYAKWLGSQDEAELIYYIQYQLHVQLLAAADYARSKGIILKGDVPIGVNRDSVETATHPELFNMDCSTGAPPDAFSLNGQNWGFPTYNWHEEQSGRKKHHQVSLSDWFRQRMKWMEQYFDAFRIDHVLGFFRIWEIPQDAVFGIMGHFSPAMPFAVNEIEYFGLSFRRDLFTRPFINDRVLERLFGVHAQYVRDNFLVPLAYGLYGLREEYNTQRKVQARFEGRNDENSLWIRDGLYRLISDVLFVEDPRQPEMYHPRIGAWQEPVYEALTAEEKDAYMRLYNNFFYQRHNFFWGQNAVHRLKATVCQTQMLCCAEDLGMLPDCVSHVLDHLRILTLEIQSMPKQNGFEFSHLDGNPYRSVATFSTHDMPPLRLWWEESPERTQRYYATMLQKQGRAPEHLPAHLAEEIIARHLYCPSMLCLLSLQDWLAMDSELRSKHVREERINVPSDSYNRWKYRMHITIEELLQANKYNNKVKTMITRSKR